MNREEWLRAVQRESLERYDTIWGPLYAEGRTGNYPNAQTRQPSRVGFHALSPSDEQYITPP